MSWKRIVLFAVLLVLSASGVTRLFSQLVPRGMAPTTSAANMVAALELVPVLGIFTTLAYRQRRRPWLHALLVSLAGLTAVLLVNFSLLGFRLPESASPAILLIGLNELALFAAAASAGVFWSPAFGCLVDGSPAQPCGVSRTGL